MGQKNFNELLEYELKWLSPWCCIIDDVILYSFDKKYIKNEMLLIMWLKLT